MNAELQNVMLMFEAIYKTGLMTGLGIIVALFGLVHFLKGVK